jgi:hypothetical protein
MVMSMKRRVGLSILTREGPEAGKALENNRLKTISEISLAAL